MATVVQHPTFKIIVETETERAKREFASLSESTQKEAKKISLAMSGDNWGPNVLNNTPYSGVHQLGGLASYRGGVSNFSTLLGSIGATGILPPLIEKSIISAGKKIGNLFENKIVSGGVSAAASMSGVLFEEVKHWKEVAYDVGHRYYDMSAEEVKLGKYSGAESGGMKGGTIGGLVGAVVGGAIGLIGGPAGAAAGAKIGGSVGGGIGTVSGAFKGWFSGGEEAIIKQRARWNAQNIERNQARQERLFRIAENASNWGLEEMMSRQGGRMGRISLLKERRDQIMSGGGDWSIKNINARLNAMEQADREGYEGQKWQRRLEHQQAKADDLALRIEQMKMTTRYNPLEAGFGADEYARKGLYVGAQIDVQDVNREILAELKRQTEYYRKFMENQFEHGVFNKSDDVVGMLIR